MSGNGDLFRGQHINNAIEMQALAGLSLEAGGAQQTKYVTALARKEQDR